MKPGLFMFDKISFALFREDQKLVANRISFADDKHMFNLKQNQMKKNYLFGAAFVLALMGTACNNAEDMLQDGRTTMKVTVKNNVPESRAIIHGESLPSDAEIGVTLLNAAGEKYDGVEYSNLKYTNGTPWATTTAPLLSSTDGKAIAYFPYGEDVKYTAIELSTDDQTDNMYSGWVTGINNSNPEAKFTMNHAKSAFRVILKKHTDYNTEAKATSITATSAHFVETAKLNAEDGTLSGRSEGEGNVTVAIADGGQTLDDGDANFTDIMVIPAETPGSEVTFTVTINDANNNPKSYTVTSPFTTSMAQGKCYAFTLTLTATGFTVSSVTVTDWGTPETGGSGDLTPAA